MNSDFLFNSVSLIFVLLFELGFFSKKFINGNLKISSASLVPLLFEKGKIGCFVLETFSS